MNSILKAPLLRGFFSLWLLAAGVGAAELVDSSQVVDSVKLDSAVVESGYVVRIKEVGLHGGLYIKGHDFDTIDVTIEGFGKGIGGFDIKIGVDSAFFSILRVLPGELIDSCQWKLFDARKRTNLPTTQLPIEVWQVIALSQTIPDSTGPKCFGFDRPVTIMRLIADVNSPGDFADSIKIVKAKSYPIFFYWEDCTDNTLSTEGGDTLCISSRVFGRGAENISEKRPSFPSRSGAPRECFGSQRPNSPRRVIDFYNGGYFVPAMIKGVGTD